MRGPATPARAASTGARSRDAARALVNDAIRPDALLQPGPDLARRPSLSHLARDEATHVQAVVRVVVVEHAEPPGGDGVVGGGGPAVGSGGRSRLRGGRAW